MCAATIFPLIFYWLSVLPMPERYLPSPQVRPKGRSTVFPRMLNDSPQTSWVQWPFTASKRTVSGTSDELRFGPSQRATWLDDRGDLVPLELGARFGLLEQVRVLAHLVASTECVAPFRLEFQSGPGRHARLFSLRQWLRRNGWARLLLQRVSSPVLGSRREVNSSYRTQAARAARRWLRRRQRFTPVLEWEACGVSRDPSCSQNRDLDDAKEGIVWRCKLFSSWSDIVLLASA